MSYDQVLYEKQDGVAIITLNRPEVLNAMSNQLTNEMDAALTEAEGDDEVGAVVITGSGNRAFTAGGDIHEQKRNANELSDEEKAIRGEAGARHAWHLATFSKPTIGALNGLAYGGGARLAATFLLRGDASGRGLLLQGNIRAENGKIFSARKSRTFLGAP